MRWRRRRPQTDFASEVQAHIDLEAERLRAEGLNENEASAQARKSFGNVLRSNEQFYESQRWLWLDHLKQDFLYALRQLSNNKGFAIVAILTLALGVGSTTAIFTLVDATLLRPLPYREGDRIVRISDVRLRGQSTGGLVSVPRFFDLCARTKSYDSLAFFYFDQPTLIAGSSLPVPLHGAGVNGNFWQTIGVQPILGRAFNEADDRPNSPSVAIISYAAWQRDFAGSPDVINRQVLLDGKPATIIGVLPPGLEYPHNTDIWTTAKFDPSQWTYRGEGTRFINVVGRLKANVSIFSARQELRSIADRLRREYTKDANWQFGAESLRDALYGPITPALLTLLAASGVLLLIACVNVANLLLSRATTRAQEVSMRRALGASQGRIFAQFLTENSVLALLGGGIGLAATYFVLRVCGPILPGTLGRSGVQINWVGACFTFAVSVLTGLVFGCLPVVQTRRLDLNASLKQGDNRVAATGGSRMRTTFISIEVALSLVLLVGAGLLAESLWNLIKSPLGFQPQHVLTFEIKLPWDAKPAAADRFFDDLQSRVETLPGVIAVGQVSAPPTVDWHLRSNFDVDWKPRTPHGDAVNVEDRSVSGSYFRAMGIPLIAGRIFNEADRQQKPPRAIVNQQFARQYLPGGNLIGRHLINQITRFEIVGVVGDVRGTAGSIAAAPGPELYFPSEGEGVIQRYFVVRSPLPEDRLVKAIRDQVHQIDPAQAVRNIATLDRLLDQSVAQPRFNMGLLSAFAIAALLLACVGIYGVVSYSVAQRSIEVGIRIALGATRSQISYLFVGRALQAALIGLFAGAIAALFLTRLLQSQLYGVAPNHLVTFLASALLLLIPTLFASLIPASRAASVNPVTALRRD